MSADDTLRAISAAGLRDIAAETKNPRHRAFLIRLAAFFDDPKMPLRLVFEINRRGPRKKWEKRYAVARDVHEYRRKHGGTLTAAYEVLAGKPGMPSARTIQNNWQEFGCLFKLDENYRTLILFFLDQQSKEYAVRTERRHHRKRLPNKCALIVG